MALVQRSLDEILSSEGAEFDASRPCYWRAEHHSTDSDLRDEAWRPHIADLLLPARQVVVPLPFAGGEALLRYHEEFSMYAALHDERATADIDAGARAAAMLDAAFLDARAAAMADEWPRGSATMRGWWSALEALRGAIDTAIAGLGVDAAARGVFVKLSVRSPKDAAVCVPAFRRELDAWMAATHVAPDSPLALSDTVCAIKRASWLALRCHSGAEVIQVLARSDRVYRDILQHTLFNRGGDFADADEAAARTAAERSFALNVHVSEFFDGFDPAFEFRGFVCGGRQACLTAYSPWIYSPAMVRERDAILASIQRVWTAASQRLPAHLRDYSIDFAVSPHDVSLCWVVEVNATLPPLAGSGLFDVHDARDAALLRGEGEFEFRLLERALTDADFLTERTDVKTGRVTRTQMLPAPVHVMRALDAARCQKFGVPYKAAVAAEAVAKSGSSDTDASAETICAIM